MGQNQSEATSENFYKDYEELRREHDQRFGEVVIYRKKNHPDIQVMTKEKVFQNSEEYEKFKSQLRRHQLLARENVCQILLTIGILILRPRAGPKRNVFHFPQDCNSYGISRANIGAANPPSKDLWRIQQIRKFTSSLIKFCQI